MSLRRSVDEEVVAICENDSCAIDALQVLLGTVAGKGNLIIKDFGKNAYTVLSRQKRLAYRFARKTGYDYKGKAKSEFEKLDAAVSAGIASETERKRLKKLKMDDLLARPFPEIFTTRKVRFQEPLYAPLAPSLSCALCGEMTMATKMVKLKGGRQLCIPCSEKSRNKS
jgi:formylmethanofuran dehydrogenase subunit E